MLTLPLHFQGTNQRSNLRKHKSSDQLPLDELAADHLGRKCPTAEASHPSNDGLAVEGEAAAAATTASPTTAATLGAQLRVRVPVLLSWWSVAGAQHDAGSTSTTGL